MKNVLLITSSPRGEDSLSTQVATRLAGQIAGARITTRALWQEPLPPIDPRFQAASFTPEENRTPEQRRTLALSDQSIAQLQEADIVVIAAGLINFGIPATLKTWIDYVTRAGKTFRYGAGGPEGLVRGKKVILVLAYGGVYSTGPMASMNFMEPHLRTSLGFLGMTDVEVVRIEGTSLGAESAARAIGDAQDRAGSLAAAYSG